MKSATVFIAVLFVAAVAVQSTKSMPAVGEQYDIEQFGGQYAAEEQGRRQQQEEISVFADTLSQGEGLPETNNYDVLVQPMSCVCCCRRCCNRRMIRASDDAVDTRNILNNWDRIRNGNGNRWRGGRKTNGRGNDNRRDVTDNELRITVLGSRTELKQYSTQQDLAELYNSKVVRAELYERPLDKDTEPAVAAALKGKQSAVVTTLSDGRRFLVVKGNQKGEGSETIAIIADHMTDDWVKVSTSTITRSTLGDFIKAGGFEYDPLLDNGRSAAMRMMILE